MAVETTIELQRNAQQQLPDSSLASDRSAAATARMALQIATSRLANHAPHFSAHTPLWARQTAVLGLVVGLIVTLFAMVPAEAGTGLLVAVAIPFALIVIFRTVAIAIVLSRPGRPSPATTRADDHTLPTYSVLVPLVDEANMAPQIVTALSALDYPMTKLEVLVVLEADDTATQIAFEQQNLPPHFRVVIVPSSLPRTKPKALNFALRFARGDYVVVYDAEDLPSTDQLREAAAMFTTMPHNVACLQARLLIHNSSESWLTRQFSLEYMALFDGLLPTYQALGVPLPLGGTSNHFPRHLLDRIGGWDPYNVTEDADLGIRLVRLGYEARMLPSETWEEAPAHLSGWVPQRTRWLKGWLQTWFVHTRHPLRSLREMGLVAFTGFHMIFGGMILAALVHPIMYLLLIWQYLTIGPFAAPIDQAGLAITGLTAFNLGLGYLSAMLLCAVSAMRRGQSRLLFSIITLPVYWLLVSAAAWRALVQFIVAPFRWEKTQHHAKRP